MNSIRCTGSRARAAVWLAATLLALGLGSARADFSSPAVDWALFNNPDAQGYIRPNLLGGQVENDFEGSQDPTNGGTGVQPDTADISSNTGTATVGGDMPSSYFGYYDGGTPWNPSVPSTMEDDYVFFRMRMVKDCRKNTTTSGGFVNVFFNVIIDTDGDGYKEYWVALNGDHTANATDKLSVYYENLPRQDFADIATAEVAFFTAGNTASAVSHTRTYPVSDVYPADTSGEWFIEMQVPLTAFNDTNGNQVIFPDSAIGIGFSTGTSNNDPLQKDHAGDYTGGIPYDPDNPIFFPPPIALVPPAFPSPYPGDGKFVVLAGNDLDTFDERNFVFFIGIPAGETSFYFEIFDGEGGNQSPWYSGHWDWFTTNTRYELFADPNKVGTGGTSLGVLTGNDANTSNGSLTVTTAFMPDNGWYRVTVPAVPAALAPSGNYFYRLEMSLIQDGGVDPKAFQCFKIRASANTTMSVRGLFQFMAAISTLQDYNIIYPGDTNDAPPLESTDPLVNGRAYDGSWSIFASVGSAVTRLRLWDGDFDRVGDTDDPNTPNTVPSFASSSPGAMPEGANAIGIPEDDYGSSVEAPNPVTWRRVTPAVFYTVTSPDPDGASGPLTATTYTNSDPSGNGEFELYQIGTSAHTDNDVTVAGAQLQPGWWSFTFGGVDINNLNALYIDGEMFSRPHAPLLNPTGTITGALTAPASGGVRTPGSTTATVGNQVITLRGTDSVGAAVERTTTTAANGTYAFDGLRAGRYELFVGAAATPARSVPLEPGQVRSGVVLSAPAVRGVKEIDGGVRGGGTATGAPAPAPGIRPAAARPVR